MKIQLTSVATSDLVKGKLYLCGEASLVDEIYWYLCTFDGERLHKNGVYPVCQPESDFFPFHYSLDGYTSDWLIFELPLVGFPDNGAGLPGELCKHLLSVVSPNGEKAMLEL